MHCFPAVLLQNVLREKFGGSIMRRCRINEYQKLLFSKQKLKKGGHYGRSEVTLCSGIEWARRRILPRPPARRLREFCVFRVVSFFKNSRHARKWGWEVRQTITASLRTAVTGLYIHPVKGKHRHREASWWRWDTQKAVLCARWALPQGILAGLIEQLCVCERKNNNKKATVGGKRRNIPVSV